MDNLTKQAVIARLDSIINDSVALKNELQDDEAPELVWEDEDVKEMA